MQSVYNVLKFLGRTKTCDLTSILLNKFISKEDSYIRKFDCNQPFTF